MWGRTIIMLIAGVLALGCGKKSDLTPAQTVEHFFVAVQQGDCPGALEHIGGDAKERFAATPCDEMLQLMRKKHFLGVVAATQDGRDDKATIVRVRFEDEAQPALIRVRTERGVPRITSM